MVFTLAGEVRKLRDEANRAWEKGKEAGRQEERKKRDAEWLKWLEAVKPDLAAGRPPSIPPPSATNAELAFSAGQHHERWQWTDWYESVKEDLAAGRRPSAPPPSTRRGGAAD